jgi:hypothetical protein
LIGAVVGRVAVAAVEVAALVGGHTSIHCRMEDSASGFFTSGDCLSPSSWSGVDSAQILLLLRLLLWSAGTSIHCRMEGSASGFFTSGDCLSPSSWSGVGTAQILQAVH